MPSFWEKLKQPFKAAGKTVSSWFKGQFEEIEREKELAPVTMEHWLGIGKKESELLKAAKSAARGVVKGVTLGYVEPEALKPKTEEERRRYAEPLYAPEKLAEMGAWLLPFAGVTKGLGLAIKGATKIPTLARVAARVAPKVPKLVKGMAQLAVPFAVYEALAKPEEGETRADAAMSGALIGAIFPLAGAALKPIAKPILAALKKGSIKRLEGIILQLRGEKVSYEEIGKQIGKTAKWVEQIEAKALAKIKPEVKAEVIAGVAKPEGVTIFPREAIKLKTPPGLELTAKQKVWATKQHEYAHQSMRKLSVMEFFEESPVFKELKALAQKDISIAKPPIGKEVKEVIADVYALYKIKPQHVQKRAPNLFRWMQKNGDRFGKLGAKELKGIPKELPAIKPPIKPPKPPTPRVISPIPKPPPELKITPRRAGEINKMGVSPEEFAPALAAQRRGVIPFPEIIKRSEALTANINKIATMRPGTIKTAEQVEAYRQVVNGFKADVKKLEQNYVADVTNTANKAIFDNARAKLNRAIINIEAIRSEMARGLSAARIETEISRAASNLNKVRAQLPAEKQLIFDKRVDAISLEEPAEVMKLITEFQKSSFLEKVLEYYKASLLSAWITQIRNFGGNTVFMMFDIPVRALAGGLDAVKSVGGRPRTVYTREALRMIYSGPKAVAEGTIEAMKAIRDEFYQYGARRMTIEAGMRVPAIKGLKGRIIRIPYRFLSAMDLFGRRLKMTVETEALSYRMARQEGKKGLELIQRIEEIKRTPSAEMIDLVTRKAERFLFLEEFSGVLKGLESMKNKYPALQFIIPFYRTPVNLVREAYRMSPIRLVGVRKDPWLLNQSTRMEEVSRMILGSLISGTIIWKMVDGSIEITGAAPYTKAERDLFYRQGKMPYSVKLGDNWYSYREIHPFATIMFTAAQIGEGIKLYQKTGELTEKEIEKQADKLITDTAGFIQDLTFFQGLGNFMEAMSGGTFNQGYLSVGPRYLAQLFGGFIPNFLYSFTRAADPTIYLTTGFKEQILKRIPGMAESLIPRRDIYGQPLKRPGYFITRFLSPIQVSKVRRDLVDEEMVKIDLAVGYPTKTAFGEALTDYEYDAYLKDSGARIYEQLWMVMSSAEYKARPNYEKYKVISKIVRETRERSRYALFTEKKRIADYKKSLVAQGYTEAQAEDMAERRFGKPEEETRTMAEMFKTYQPVVAPKTEGAEPTMAEMFGAK